MKLLHFLEEGLDTLYDMGPILVLVLVSFVGGMIFEENDKNDYVYSHVCHSNKQATGGTCQKNVNIKVITDNDGDIYWEIVEEK